MKHLGVMEHRIPVDKILSNWSTTSDFIYGQVTIDQLKSLLKSEVLNKNRSMIVERLTIRLLSLMKLDLRDEINLDIGELNGIRESD